MATVGQWFALLCWLGVHKVEYLAPVGKLTAARCVHCDKRFLATAYGLFDL